MSDSVYSMTVYCYLTYLVQVGEGSCCGMPLGTGFWGGGMKTVTIYMSCFVK